MDNPWQIVTAVAVGLEVLAAVVLAILNIGEVRFLEERVRPHLRKGEELPLFDALTQRAKGITLIAFWLLGLTALGLVWQPTDHFPFLRAINGLLLLYLIAGPRIYGIALRSRVKSDD